MKHSLRVAVRWTRREVPVGVLTGILGTAASSQIASVAAAASVEIGVGLGVVAALGVGANRARSKNHEIQVRSFFAGVHITDFGQQVELTRIMEVGAFGVRRSFEMGAVSWDAGPADLASVIVPFEQDQTRIDTSLQPDGMVGLTCRLNDGIRHRKVRKVGFTAAFREDEAIVHPFVALNCAAFAWSPGATAEISLTWDASSSYAVERLVAREFAARSEFEFNNGTPNRTVLAERLTPSPNRLGYSWNITPRGSEFYRLEVMPAHSEAMSGSR